ncbi:MAG: CoA-binding protein, partial [Thermodesulfobacteriota bacterium]|nr:CoA-binding protein [Thermodesulfobacteriota bacterium]
YTNIPTALLEDKNIDMLMMYFLMPVEFATRNLEHQGMPPDQANEVVFNKLTEQFSHIVDLLKSHNKPIVGYTFRSREERGIRWLIDQGIPVFPGTERAARALEALARSARLRDKILAGAEPSQAKTAFAE